MSIRALVALAALVGVLAAAQTGDAPKAPVAPPALSEYEEHLIKCDVCFHAVRHIWRTGEILREHCEQPEHELRRDDDCDLGYVTESKIQLLVNSTCGDLPHLTHGKVSDEGAFRMVFHHDDSLEPNPEFETPKHDAAIVARIIDVCQAWLHHNHDAELVANLVYSNLWAGKKKEHIMMPLMHRFCQHACNLEKPIHRRRKRKVAEHGEPDIDWTWAHAQEQKELLESGEVRERQHTDTYPDAEVGELHPDDEF